MPERDFENPGNVGFPGDFDADPLTRPNRGVRTGVQFAEHILPRVFQDDFRC